MGDLVLSTVVRLRQEMGFTTTIFYDSTGVIKSLKAQPKSEAQQFFTGMAMATRELAVPWFRAVTRGDLENS